MKNKRINPLFGKHAWAGWLLSLITVSLLLIAGFNILVDGYSLFGMPILDGFNQSRRPGDVRLYKAYDIQRAAYDAVILGSSRSEIGLDPDHPAWQGYRAYNLAMPGASMDEILRYLQHAHAAHPLKKVFLGLDFVVFSGRAHWPHSFVDERLLVDKQGLPQKGTFLKDALNAVFSKDAFDKSLETLKASRRNEPGSHTGHGQAAHEDPFNYVLRGGGYHNVFRAIEDEYLGKKGWGSRPVGKRYFQDNNTEGSSLDIYEALLRFCHEHRIELVMEISPIHVDLLMGLKSTGMFPTFEQWKQELVRINEVTALQYGRPEYPLWDFSEVNHWTTEPLPPVERDRTIDGMQWFWDAAHYRSTLGDLLESRALSGDEQQPELGELINSDVIKPHLARQRNALEQYISEHPAEWNALAMHYPPRRTKPHRLVSAPQSRNAYSSH